MYLKSMTLRGFKSFASATTLEFEPGITCVVGPNGSGKSNVVDALAWVMGQQAAKSLRGGKMEDVIFAGTSGRAALGRAEVSLTIDNSDGALPIEYTEVTITRTMFRGGGSEYRINGDSARLLDVQELLSDSGIGREMHVIVQQGQLDAILQATPEERRGFIEEAAGVLKHRKRKERALRKLESTEGNLNRLTDLVAEIRRQLKPLGRQAEVARKATVIQAEVRDASARLLADDLVQARLALASDTADEESLQQRRAQVESDVEHARRLEAETERELEEIRPGLDAAHERWYGLQALGERVRSTASIAQERARTATERSQAKRTGRDPRHLRAEADQVAETEATLRQQVEARQAELDAATERRESAEELHRVEEHRLASVRQAIADRREGLARLTGQVNALKSRIEAVASETERLEAARDAARDRAEQANKEFAALESRVAGMDAGEVDLDAEYEQAAAEAEALEERLAGLRREDQQAQQKRAAAAARVEALKLGLERKDAAGELLAASDRVGGLLGSVAALVQVEAGYEAAVAAAFGTAADAVAAADLDAAMAAVQMAREEDWGRAGLLLGGGPDEDVAEWPRLPEHARYLADVVSCDDRLRPAVTRVLRHVVVVDDLTDARGLVRDLPEVTAVTRDGDVLTTWLMMGGSGGGQSLIEAQAALEKAEGELVDADHAVERVRFAMEEARREHAAAEERVEAAVARLHESDAQMAAVAEELGNLNTTARQASAEAVKAEQDLAAGAERREQDARRLEELEERLARAGEDEVDEDDDPAERDRLSDVARQARSEEMDIRLSLRTTEERLRAVEGRAESLRRAAVAEEQARERAEEARKAAAREAERARAVAKGAEWLSTAVAAAAADADAERAELEQSRKQAQETVSEARRRSRTLAEELQQLVDAAHREEMARAQQRMRVEALSEKAMEELGLGADVLCDEFGPEVPVPVLTRPDGSALTEDDEQPDPVPYVRAEQEKRLRKARKNLQVLGKVNPLALEEFDAMTERHAFLAEQLDDLHRTRADLAEIIKEVDKRVEEVFADAYRDVEAAFEQVFATLFPGGDGRLVLTEPGEWLTTGVEVEARPASKKVKRLSLLSGGERSLVAVAFLVSLFIARPSPFYILDEVEAALDDTNLGRLLDIYQQLRANSQLLVITHQKRTMEIADALYGVTMRGDGVSKVISQRLDDNR